MDNLHRFHDSFRLVNSLLQDDKTMDYGGLVCGVRRHFNAILGIHRPKVRQIVF